MYKFINFQNKEVILEKSFSEQFISIPRVGEGFRLNGAIVRIMDVEYVFSKSSSLVYDQVIFTVEVFKAETN
jgi:hypothetical protein